MRRSFLTAPTNAAYSGSAATRSAIKPATENAAKPSATYPGTSPSHPTTDTPTSEPNFASTAGTSLLRAAIFVQFVTIASLAATLCIAEVNSVAPILKQLVATFLAIETVELICNAAAVSFWPDSNVSVHGPLIDVVMRRESKNLTPVQAFYGWIYRKLGPVARGSTSTQRIFARLVLWISKPNISFPLVTDSLLFLLALAAHLVLFVCLYNFQIPQSIVDRVQPRLLWATRTTFMASCGVWILILVLDLPRGSFQNFCAINFEDGGGGEVDEGSARARYLEYRKVFKLFSTKG